MTHLTSLAFMWLAMMAAMMAPTVWPWIRSFHRFGGSTLAFGSGYLAAWLVYSFAAAAIQITLHPPASIAPLLLIAAGLYQFAPLKRACLTHCRNPITYFLARWRGGPIGGFRMGAAHGVYCVGCCWALMATMLAAGLANLPAMVALAAVTMIEQVVPHGEQIRKPLGIVLIAAAFV